MTKLGTVLCVLSLFLVAGVVSVPADEGPERGISLNEVPAVAKAVIEKFADGGKIEEVKMEEEDGQVVYEAEVEKDGRDSKIEVTAAGKTLETAVEVTLDDLPDPVKTTMNSFGAIGEVDDLVMVAEGEKITYEAEVEIGDKDYEIEVSPAGTVLEMEAEGGHHSLKADDDDDDDDGEDADRNKEDDDDEGEEEEDD